MLTAIFLPARANAFQAISEASRRQIAGAGLSLYTNGERLAWLPRPMPGWFRLGACERTAA